MVGLSFLWGGEGVQCPLLGDCAVGRVQERGALGKMHRAECAHWNAVRVDDVVVGVSEELERKPILPAEGLMTLDGVQRYSEYDSIERILRLKVTLEIVCFDSASAALALPIEVQHDPLALIVGQRYGRGLLGGLRKVG